MKKSTSILIALIAVITMFVAALYVVDDTPSVSQQDVVSGYKNITLTTPDGTSVTLVNGVAEIVLGNDMATKIVIRYFGNELHTDLNGDDLEDVVFLITEDGGGSGTYFYVVAAINTQEGYIGSDAVLLGDRIAPQTTELSQNPSHKNVIVVNYADRAVGEPMTTPPSVGQSLYLKLDKTNRWGIVESNFEGEADSGRMSLGMKTWVWQSAQYNDGRESIFRNPNAFTLTFLDNNTVDIGTDCNSAGGDYVHNDDTIAFTNMRTTLMYCEGSQETEFIKLLEDIHSFYFTSRGELVFDLKHDSGTLTFK
jgi:heat shock protein HslJ